MNRPAKFRFFGGGRTPGWRSIDVSDVSGGVARIVRLGSITHSQIEADGQIIDVRELPAGLLVYDFIRIIPEAWDTWFSAYIRIANGDDYIEQEESGWEDLSYTDDSDVITGSNGSYSVGMAVAQGYDNSYSPYLPTMTKVASMLQVRVSRPSLGTGPTYVLQPITDPFTGGTFTVTVNDVTTDPLPFDISVEDLEDALAAIRPGTTVRHESVDWPEGGSQYFMEFPINTAVSVDTSALEGAVADFTTVGGDGHLPTTGQFDIYALVAMPEDF